MADHEDVEIRTYEIIYKLLEDIEQAVIGMLEPEYEEHVTGEAEVREIFRVPKIGAIAGCLRPLGCHRRGSKVRFLRDGTIIWKGDITSLKRFKDDAREVREGFECGIGLSDFQDLKPGDLIETFEDVEIARRLRMPAPGPSPAGHAPDRRQIGRPSWPPTSTSSSTPSVRGRGSPRGG